MPQLREADSALRHQVQRVRELPGAWQRNHPPGALARARPASAQREAAELGSGGVRASTVGSPEQQQEMMQPEKKRALGRGLSALIPQAQINGAVSEAASKSIVRL